MINRILITGDTHGDFTRFRNYDTEIQRDENTAIIILGDVGLNFTLDEHDSQLKNYLTKKYSFRIYCLHGNHEARPQNIDGMHLIYDEDVLGEVYIQDKWPQIRYFKDWGIYAINNHKTAVIGGAYSVDKYYRLDRGLRWFADEMLTYEEQLDCMNELWHQSYDFVLTHTCPIEWEPTDLFLRGIDQSKVDKTMESFLSDLKFEINGKIWCFGHYHCDRLERPCVEQFFKDTENIEDIWNRWRIYSATGDLAWWLVKSPNFYMT